VLLRSRSFDCTYNCSDLWNFNRRHFTSSFFHLLSDQFHSKLFYLKMITVRKYNIPEYLQRGELFRSLVENNDDPDEEVSFPTNVLKPDVSVNTLEDCDLLLNSVRFWGVQNFVSVEMITFILCHSDSNNVSVFEKYETEFSFVHGLRCVAGAHHLDKVECAIESGITELVVGAAERFQHLVPENACEIAAAVGSVEIVSYLRSHGCIWNNASEVAAYHGHINILRYWVEQGNEIEEQDLLSSVAGTYTICSDMMHCFTKTQ